MNDTERATQQQHVDGEQERERRQNHATIHFRQVLRERARSSAPTATAATIRDDGSAPTAVISAGARKYRAKIALERAVEPAPAASRENTRRHSASWP